MIAIIMGAPEVMIATPRSELELSVVMPVYNEADAVGPVVWAWIEELDRPKIRYESLCCDDGSRDRTADVLRQVASEKRPVVAKSRANVEHGPTGLGAA